MELYVKYLKTSVQCPYCNFENVISLSCIHKDRMNIVLCGVEGGGCDSYFGYQIDKVVIHKSIYKMERVYV